MIKAVGLGGVSRWGRGRGIRGSGSRPSRERSLGTVDPYPSPMARAGWPVSQGIRRMTDHVT